MQDNARVKMAIHHRASHERLRDAIFASADRIMNLVAAKDEIQDMTTKDVITYANLSLEKELDIYKETLVSSFQSEDVTSKDSCQVSLKFLKLK